MIRDKEISGMTENSERMIKRYLFNHGVLQFALLEDESLLDDEDEFPEDLRIELQILHDSWVSVNQLLHHYGLMP